MEGCDLSRVHGSRRKRRIVLPREFSFLESPDEAIEALEQVARTVAGKHTAEIFLDQNDCTLVDYGAESALGALASDSKHRHGIGFSGRTPKDPEMARVALATGVARMLGAVPELDEGILTFPLRKGMGTTARATESSPADFAATQLAEYVDQCLGASRMQLSRDGHAKLTGLIGEVLTNAGEHSKRGDWWLSGYFVPEQLDLHLSVFGFGRTLAQSLQALPKEAKMRGEIERLVRKHKDRGLFRAGWSEDDLWTLYALQEGVSRFHVGEHGPEGPTQDRGQGLSDLISFFQALAASGPAREPRMCIVSGSTQILFSSRYKMREVGEGLDVRRVIAFNAENSLEIPPDSSSVRSLKRFLPGTLVSLRLILAPQLVAAQGAS